MESTAVKSVPTTNVSNDVIEIEQLNVTKDLTLKGVKISFHSEMSDDSVAKVTGLVETLAGIFMEGLKLVSDHETKASIRRAEERDKERQLEERREERREKKYEREFQKEVEEALK